MQETDNRNTMSNKTEMERQIIIRNQHIKTYKINMSVNYATIYNIQRLLFTVFNNIVLYLYCRHTYY